MATSFNNLQEYILFRTEVRRELFNREVDTNFQMVSNPWVESRIYEIGNIVYHPVVIDDPTTTGEDQVLVWWRANIRTTQGVFDTSEWDIIGGVGSGSISVSGSNGFGKININSTLPTGALQNGSNALMKATVGDDTFNLIAGQGMQLQYNLASKSIVLINSLASNPGEANLGENIGQGVTHQDVYAGKSGVNLQFRGFDATNTTGTALSISTNNVQDNIVYNFNEAKVNLANLNDGAPLIGMLSNVSDVIPQPLDILQWNAGSGVWAPTSLGSLGQQNIYTTSSLILDADRIVRLNGAVGNLQFNRSSDLGTGVHISNLSNQHQLQLRNSLADGVTGIQHSLAGVVKANTGVYAKAIGVPPSYYITMGASPGGLTVDALGISANNELYIPQLTTDTMAAVDDFKVPMVSQTLASGRFDSDDNWRGSVYKTQDVAQGWGIRTLQFGENQIIGYNDQTPTFFTSTIKSLYTPIPNFKGYSQNMSLTYDSVAEGNNLSQFLSIDFSRYIGSSIITNPVPGETPAATKYIGSNISLSYKNSLAITVGEMIYFTEADAGGSPQTVGLYSNVVDTFGPNENDGEAVLTDLITDSGTWAGYFVGCVNIDKGGLVLPSLAANPACNDVSGGTISERTLWINSANGHLYRGYVDVEAGGSGGATSLGQLTDVRRMLH